MVGKCQTLHFSLQIVKGFMSLAWLIVFHIPYILCLYKIDSDLLSIYS